MKTKSIIKIITFLILSFWVCAVFGAICAERIGPLPPLECKKTWCSLQQGYSGCTSSGNYEACEQKKECDDQAFSE